MKFARDFRESLANQDFPQHWIDQAIPYGQLKKCLKKVQRELEDLGLDPETLRSLSDPESTSPVALKYQLQAYNDSKLVRPTLTVDVYLEEGVIVDASLTSSSRRFLERVANDIATNGRRLSIDASSPHTNSDISPGATTEDDVPSTTTAGPAATPETSNRETIEVPLVFDHQFFEMLQSDVCNIDILQAEEQRNMCEEIIELRNEISAVSKPSRLSKTDLARWRSIFELYLDAEVFFATHEQNHGSRTSDAALKQLQWFQKQVEKKQLTKDFKLVESQMAFSRFIKLNASLLKNLQFQELNQTAVFKILKKFDKRTSLGISKSFRSAVQPHKLMAGSMSKAVCAQMSQELVTVVPQLNDYLCPVCFSVAYQPVRLDCQHVFCIRCVVKIQRRQEKYCPLCRADVMMQTSAKNLDITLSKYMKKYFAKEVKEKQRSNEIERGIEDYGPEYTHNGCTVM